MEYVRVQWYIIRDDDRAGSILYIIIIYWIWLLGASYFVAALLRAAVSWIRTELKLLKIPTKFRWQAFVVILILISRLNTMCPTTATFKFKQPQNILICMSKYLYVQNLIFCILSVLYRAYNANIYRIYRIYRIIRCSGYSGKFAINMETLKYCSIILILSVRLPILIHFFFYVWLECASQPTIYTWVDGSKGCKMWMKI